MTCSFALPVSSATVDCDRIWYCSEAMVNAPSNKGSTPSLSINMRAHPTFSHADGVQTVPLNIRCIDGVIKSLWLIFPSVSKYWTCVSFEIKSLLGSKTNVTFWLYPLIPKVMLNSEAAVMRLEGVWMTAFCKGDGFASRCAGYTVTISYPLWSRMLKEQNYLPLADIKSRLNMVVRALDIFIAGLIQ